MPRTKKAAGRSLTVYLDSSVILGLNMDAEAQERSISYIANQILKEHYKGVVAQKKEGLVGKNQEAPSQNEIEDKYTIIHKKLRGGGEVRYTMKEVEGRIRHYSNLLEDEDIQANDKKRQNAEEKLSYWESRKRELQGKMKTV